MKQPEHQDQETLEQEQKSLGAMRYRRRVAKMRSMRLETCTTACQRALIRSCSLHAEAIKSWIHTAKRAPGRMHSVLPLLDGMDPSLCAFICCRILLDGIAGSRTINSLAMAVGRAIEDEHKFLHARLRHPQWFRKVSSMARRHPVDSARARFVRNSARMAGIVLPQWKPKQRAAVGLVLIELLKQSSGIIEIVTQKGSLGKDVTLVRATDEFLSWLDKSHAACEQLAPVYMPMVRRPRSWDTPWMGGYLTLSPRSRPLIKTANKSHLDVLSALGMPEVYQAVNSVQATGFRVDPRMLEVLKHCWEHDLAIGDLPSRIPLPFPEFPEHAREDPEARKTWRRLAGRIKFDNECARSRRITVSRTLWLAEKFLGKAIWFPHELDFRGRMYPKPVFLNVQGAEWQRALLRFDEQSCPTGARRDEAMSWLAIHGANCLGHDKVSYQERLKVISEMGGMIMAIGKDPLGCMEWTKADKPFLFLAFCLQWEQAMQGGPMHLPVHIDGSNNGLQIFSLLLRDPQSAAATNCVPLASPRDIYADVADHVRILLQQDGGPLARAWLDFGIDRRTTKRIVMCMPYGLTRFSSHEYLRDWYLSRVQAGAAPFEARDVYGAIDMLCGMIWKGLDQVVGSARTCMDWLRRVARLHVEADKPIRWTSPAGLLVEQRYYKPRRVSVKTSVGSVLRQHRIIEDGEDLSMARNVNAISPNVVHSIDASVLMKAVNMAASLGVRSHACIHDSVGVLPTDVGTMASAIREVSVEIFLTPVLEILRSEMEKHSGLSLPDPPERGSLDVTSLRDADYYFS